MPIKIYDSLTKKKVDFAPLEPGKAKIYSCGVTVYDDCHIGHARSLYIFEVIRRYLRYRGLDVTFVRNITDIDDKIINKAKELGISARDVAEKYIASYERDLAALSIPKADFEPRATENIPEMIKHIEGLAEKGFAYEVEGDVYFSVRRFGGYGKLSQRACRRRRWKGCSRRGSSGCTSAGRSCAEPAAGGWSSAFSALRESASGSRRSLRRKDSPCFPSGFREDRG